MKDHMNQWLMKLKAWWGKVKEWWAPLSLREKQAVVAGGSVLGLFILYFGIWSPYLNHVAAMRSRIKSEQKTLIWMQAADKQIKKIEAHASKNNKAISPVTLLSFIQKQINQTGLDKQLTQMKQVSNDTIAIHFQKVEFDKLITLITTVSKEHGVTVAQMSAIAENTPGIVNVDITLKM